MSRILSIVLLAVLLSACASSRSTSTRTQSVSPTAVIQHPMIVDLDISDVKVTASTESRRLTEKALKADAVALAVKEAGADVLIEPRFTVERKGKLIRVEVVGRPATYRDFRKATAADSVALQMATAQIVTIHTSKDTIASKSEGKGTWAVIGSVVVGTFVTLLALGTF